MNLSELMKCYFNDLESCDDSRLVMSEGTNFINEVKEHITNRWIKVRNPERLHCRFAFSDYSSVVEFLNMVLSYQGIKGHHGKIVCDEEVVVIEVYTKDVGEITELDLSYSEDVMSIYNNLKRGNVLDV